MSTRTESTEYRLSERRLLTPGTIFTVDGVRGTFRFVKHVVTDEGVEWIDCVGGPVGHSMCRAFRPERIKTVKRNRGEG
jgi:hypothetical protein